MADSGGADLIQRARDGDARAFDMLIDPLVEPAFRLAVTMLGDRSAAEDAVQEAAFRAWRKLGLFRHGSDLRPWFLAIVANECRSVRRGRWFRVLRLEEVPEVPRQFGEEAIVERTELERALARLPRKHLLPLVLRYHLDLPVAEVADVLGCTPGAAKLRIHRALQALRPELELEVVV